MGPSLPAERQAWIPRAPAAPSSGSASSELVLGNALPGLSTAPGLLLTPFPITPTLLQCVPAGLGAQGGGVQLYGEGAALAAAARRCLACLGVGAALAPPQPLTTPHALQTYKKATIEPGPKLNLVLGPNGTRP